MLNKIISKDNFKNPFIRVLSCSFFFANDDCRKKGRSTLDLEDIESEFILVEVRIYVS